MKNSNYFVLLILLTFGCLGLVNSCVAEGPAMFKEMKIKKLLRSSQAAEVQEAAGAIGVVKAVHTEFNYVGTRGEMATITIIDHDLVSWSEDKPKPIELRRRTQNASPVLTDNTYYLVLLSPVSGSSEYFWLNDFLQLKDSEVSAVMDLVRKEYSR